MKTSFGYFRLFSKLFLIVLLVKPSFAQIETKLTAFDGDSTDLFGRSNDLCFNYSAVGANEDDNENGINAGAAYIYKRDNTGWVFQQKVVASDGAEEDNFGYSVGVSDKYIIIGSPWDDDAGEKSGSAYIFKRDGDTWVETAKLTADDAGEDNRFGITVAIRDNGNTAVVGAFFDDDFGTRTGSAYVYERMDDESWTQVTKLLPDDAAEGDWFGVSIDIDSYTIAIGSRFDDNENGVDAGAVYLFQEVDLEWVQQKKIIANDGTAGDRFHQVALHGDRLAIGASYDDDKGTSSGSVYIYKWQENDWIEEQKIISPEPDDVPSDYFGASLDIVGNRLIIGAYGNDEWGENAGKAYLYRHNGTQWDLERVIVPVDIDDGDWFGLPVTMNRGTIMISSRQDDDNGNNSGSVYSYYFYTKVFTISPDSPISISQAMTGCDYGDKIKVEPGIYNDCIDMQPGVTIYSKAGPDSVIITNNDSPYIIEMAFDAEIHDITVAGSAEGSPPEYGVLSKFGSVRVHHCIIRNCDIGIYLNNNNTCDIYNNTIDNNNLYGIALHQAYGTFIYNNIFSSNQESGIFKTEDVSTDFCSFEYNDYFGNGTNFGPTDNTWTALPGTGRIEQDPLYVGGTPFDYHLTQNSPCIDTGDPAITDDDGSVSDMGALPYDHNVKVANLTNLQPMNFCLHSAYPNPFNPKTTISFQLPKPMYAELTIFNILGERVIDLVHQNLQDGMYSMIWDGCNSQGMQMPSGVYFYRLKTLPLNNTGTAYIDVKKLVLSK